MKLKIYPSSSAFIIGDSVMTDTQSGCLRNILLAAHDVREDSIAEIHMRVGAVHESFYARTLQEDEFGSEVPVKGECDGVPYSGRADFLTKYKGEYIVHETKGTVSYNTYRKVIKDGRFKPNNLSQLVFYMGHFNTQYGKLIYAYYKEKDLLFKQVEQRTFKVIIDKSGDILIDGVHSGYTFQDHLAHRVEVARVLKANEVGDKPSGTQDGGGACNWCVFKPTCKKWDLGEITTTEEFVNDAGESLKTKLADIPEI